MFDFCVFLAEGEKWPVTHLSATSSQH